MLEWGGYEPARGSFLYFARSCLIPGKSLYVTPQILTTIRGITTGGSSFFYGGGAFEPPQHLFKNHDVDLSTEVDEIKNELPVSPLSDELMGPGPKLFFESALDLGYDCRKQNKWIYQDRCKSKCQLCVYGCPYGAKWNARDYVDLALEKGARIINHAKVEKVIIEDNKAVGVEYNYQRERYKVYASKIIISAGGIGSPLILRKSGISEAGHDFFFDPAYVVTGKIKGLNEGRAIPMSTAIYFEEDGIYVTDLNLPYLFLTGLDLEAFNFRDAFFYKDHLPIMVKVRDSLYGHISDRGWIKKTLRLDDKRKLDKGVQTAKRILKKAGAGRVYLSRINAAHPGGTIKIGEQVDANLKTKFDNLYLCDASVIPGECGIPPSFTCVALGKRLAKHLAGFN